MRSAHGGSQAHPCLTCDDERGPTGLGLRARRSWGAHRNGARVVHAPGGPVAAGVPGDPRDRHHPPSDRRPRPRHRDHAPAGPSLRRRRGDPLLRHHDPGARHRLRCRHRPRTSVRSSSSPSAAWPTSSGSGPSTPRPTRRTSSRRSTTWCATSPVPLIAFAGAPFTVASYLIEGRPSRTYVQDQGADAHRPGAVVRPDGPPGGPGDRLADARRSTTAPSAAQLFDSWAGALSPADYERYVLPASTRRCSPRSPSWACPASTSASTRRSCSGLMADGRGRGGRRRLAHAARRRPDPRPRRHGPAGQPRPRDRRGRLGRRPSPRRSTCCGAAGGNPARPVSRAATSSTSVTACCPRPTPRRSSGSSALVRRRPTRRAESGTGPTQPRRGPRDAMTVGVLVMAYGTPAAPDDVEAYYTHIRRGRPPTAGTARRPHPPLRRDRGDLAAGASGRGPSIDAIAAALDAVEPGRFVRAGGAKHAAPYIEDGVAELDRAGVDRIVGLVLAPHYSGIERRSVPRPGPRTAADCGVHVGIDNWFDLSRRSSTTRVGPSRRRLGSLPSRHRRRLHRPLAARAGARRRSLRRQPGRLRGRHRPPRRTGRFGVEDRMAVRRPDARTVARTRHPDVIDQRGRATGHATASSSSPRASPPITSRCSTTSTSRPPRIGRRRPVWRSPGPRSSTTTGPSWPTLADLVRRHADG